MIEHTLRTGLSLFLSPNFAPEETGQNPLSCSFHGGSDGKGICLTIPGDLGSIPGLGRSPAGGHGNPHQYSCLESPMDRGAWQTTVHGFKESGTTERLSLFTTLSLTLPPSSR